MIAEMRDDMLQCPKCKKALDKQGNMFSCENHHCFDLAKRGYVNLLLGNHQVTGDDKAMVQARTRFLSHGYYQPLCDALIHILESLSMDCFVDAGCGEGYYTNAIAKALSISSVFGFDLSKYAVDEACKAKQAVQYGVANVFHMPLQDACADVVTSIFAPFDIHEIDRILKPNGYFIQVGPAKEHLYELKQVLYQDVYENAGLQDVYAGFTCCDKKQMHYVVDIHNQEDIWALFQMTPYYWKTPKAGSDRLKAMSSLHTSIAFEILVFCKHDIVGK